MLDELFFKKSGDRHRANYVVYSFVLTLIGFFTALLLFPRAISYTFPLIVTLLFIPGFRKLIRGEELEVIKKRKLSRVLYYHSDVAEIVFFVFIGVFLAVLLIELVAVSRPDFFQSAFEYQITTLNDVQEYTYSITDGLMGETFDLSTYKNIGGIFAGVLLLLTFGFVFGLFYGGGGILLIILAASHLATLVVYMLASRGEFFGYFLLTALLQVFLIVPLIFSAIGGWLLSEAAAREKVKSKNFHLVLLDSLLLYGFALILSVVLVVIWNLLIRVMPYAA